MGVGVSVSVGVGSAVITISTDAHPAITSSSASASRWSTVREYFRRTWTTLSTYQALVQVREPCRYVISALLLAVDSGTCQGEVQEIGSKPLTCRGVHGTKAAIVRLRTRYDVLYVRLSCALEPSASIRPVDDPPHLFHYAEFHGLWDRDSRRRHRGSSDPQA